MSGWRYDECEVMFYHEGMPTSCSNVVDALNAAEARAEELEAENKRLLQLLHDEKSQLEIATDLADKRWIALNQIYENGEKHNAWWCKRKAQEGLGINNA